MSKINFVKADISAKGNWSMNTINLNPKHINAYQLGNIILPVQTDESGRRYVNRIYKITSEPMKAQYPSKGKDGAVWDKCVQVRTVIESKPIYLKKNEVIGQITFGNTSLHSKEIKASKQLAYIAYERISGLMLRNSL